METAIIVLLGSFLLLGAVFAILLGTVCAIESSLDPLRATMAFLGLYSPKNLGDFIIKIRKAPKWHSGSEIEYRWELMKMYSGVPKRVKSGAKRSLTGKGMVVRVTYIGL